MRQEAKVILSGDGGDEFYEDIIDIYILSILNFFQIIFL